MQQQPTWQHLLELSYNQETQGYHDPRRNSEEVHLAHMGFLWLSFQLISISMSNRLAGLESLFILKFILVHRRNMAAFLSNYRIKLKGFHNHNPR